VNKKELTNDMSFYLLADELVMTNIDQASEEKLRAVYEWASKRGNAIDVIRDIKTKINMEIDGHILDKLFTYVRLEKEIERTSSTLGSLMRHKNELSK
jgi:hypothetical protein